METARLCAQHVQPLGTFMVLLRSLTDHQFVADGVWKHDHTGKVETDDKGNVNNVLYPDDIKPPLSMAQNISSVAPGATTTQLAGEQPLLKENDLPGAFPETPAGETPRGEHNKDGLDLAGAAAGVAAGAGAVAASAAAAIGLSEEKQRQAEQAFSVNPIPASEGAGNPVHLQPGEQVPAPSTINSNTILKCKLGVSNTKRSKVMASLLTFPPNESMGWDYHNFLTSDPVKNFVYEK